jgi:hypothetical protein
MSTPAVRARRQFEADENGRTVIFSSVEIKCFRSPGQVLSESEVKRLTSQHTPPVEKGFRRVEVKWEWQVFERRIFLFIKDVEDQRDAHYGH